MRSKSSKKTTLRLSPEKFARLEKYAEKYGASINYLVNRAIVDFLDKVAPQQR